MTSYVWSATWQEKSDWIAGVMTFMIGISEVGSWDGVVTLVWYTFEEFEFV